MFGSLLYFQLIAMTAKKTNDKIEPVDNTKTKKSKWITNEKEDKQIKIKEILDSDGPIPTYLKSPHWLALKQIFTHLWNVDKINEYINMRCSVVFPGRKKPKQWFDMVIDHEFFMGNFEKIEKEDINQIKERIVWFIKDMLWSDDKHILLLWPVNIDFLTEMASKLKLSDKSEEEIKSILSSKITHMQREVLTQTMLKINAFNSITIYTWTSDNVKKIIKEKLLEIDCTKLEDVNFILAELPEEGTNMDKFAGIEKAFDMYIKDPEKKIILMSVLSLEDMKKYNKGNSKLKFLLSQKNIRFLYLFDPTAFSEFQKDTWFDLEDEKAIETIKPRPIGTFDAKILEVIFDISKQPEDEEGFQELIEREIVTFLHDTSNRRNMADVDGQSHEEQLPKLFNLPNEKKSQKRLAFENRLITILQIQHPSFVNYPREKNLQWIVDVYKYMCTKPLPEWTRYEGVFVDRDGCLYDNKTFKFNQIVINMMRRYEKEWKKITIRTQWNLETKQKLLDIAGLNYKIESKTNYKWATVEITIDNDPAERLETNARIKTENHIRITSMESAPQSEKELIDTSKIRYQWWFSDEVFDTQEIKEYIVERNGDLLWFFWLLEIRDVDVDKYLEKTLLDKWLNYNEIAAYLCSSHVRELFEDELDLDNLKSEDMKNCIDQNIDRIYNDAKSL